MKPISLRPTDFQEFIGKNNILEILRVGIEVFKETNKPLDHVLLHGQPGVGKTTLSQAIARELNSPIKIIQAINIQTLPDLISILSSIKDGECIFIDEIHSLKNQFAELLYPALEDNVLDLVVGKKFHTKHVRIQLPKFTLIAATTRLGKIHKALEDRFGYVLFLEPYSNTELIAIIRKNAELLNLVLNDQMIQQIVINSRGIPRNCNRMLKRIQNYQILKKTFNIFEIIQECGYVFKGLTLMDVRYLSFLVANPTLSKGIKTISDVLDVDTDTLHNKIEPHLIQNSLIIKTNKGRQITNKGKGWLTQYLHSQ